MATSDEKRLIDLATDIVERATAAGADVAEVSARAGWELSAKIRLGEPEMVEEAGHRSVALRVMKGKQMALTSTSDMSDIGLKRLIDDALDLADLSESDPLQGPADPELLAEPPLPELDLFDESVSAVDSASALEIAKRAEAAALAYDDRLTLSEGATFTRVTGTTAMVLSSGFTGSQRGSYASLVVSPVTEDEGGKKRRGFYWTARRHLEELEEPEAVGEEAARRTLRQLGARKIETGELPVVFDPDVARTVIGTLAGCLTGGALWRKSSYLVDRIGTDVASDLVTIIDDPLIARAPGSRPYDGEGLPSRRNTVVSSGKLETYLLDCYAARKLELKPTGSATRSGGSIGSGTSNFILQPGKISRDELIASTARGIYVTEMMGFGFNSVTGDYSRGASGFMIEDGKLTFPISEITISSNLDTMLKSIDAVASDLDLKTSTASPTFRNGRPAERASHMLDRFTPFRRA